MISPTSLRPGNWIYPTGRSKYVVVTGLLLGMMEKNEDLCKEFEGIELTPELLIAAGFRKKGMTVGFYFELHGFIIGPIYRGSWGFHPCVWVESGLEAYGKRLNYLHEAQNVYFDLVGRELPLPESALIISQTLEK